MRQLFAVIRSRGPAWQNGRPLEQQEKWTEHAAFMDALVDDGFVLLGGPLEGTSDVLLIIRAESPEEIEARLAADVWAKRKLLLPKQIIPWTLRLGTLPS